MNSSTINLIPYLKIIYKENNFLSLVYPGTMFLCCYIAHTYMFHIVVLDFHKMLRDLTLNRNVSNPNTYILIIVHPYHSTSQRANILTTTAPQHFTCWHLTQLPHWSKPSVGSSCMFQYSTKHIILLEVGIRHLIISSSVR